MFYSARHLLVALVASVCLGLPLRAQTAAPHLVAFSTDDYDLRVPQGWAAQVDAHGSVTAQQVGTTNPATLKVRMMPYDAAFNVDGMLDALLGQIDGLERVATYPATSGPGRLVVAAHTTAPMRVAAAVEPDAERDVTVVTVFWAATPVFDGLGGPQLLAAVSNSVAHKVEPDEPKPFTIEPMDDIEIVRRKPPSSGAEPAVDIRVPKLYIMHYLQDLNVVTGSGGWKVNYLLLFPDGSYYTGIPRQPLDMLRPDSLWAHEYPKMGRWTMDGERLHLDHPNLAGSAYAQRTLTYHASGGWQRKKGRVYEPAQPVSRYTLPGTYVSESSRTVGSVSMVGSEASIATAQTLVFHADGRFERDGTVGAGMRTTTGSGAGTSPFGGTGTYELDRLTLTLRYDDGRVERHLVVAWPDADRKTLAFGQKRFVKQ